MKKQFISLFLLTLTLFSLSSCNDWLDVRPDTEQKDEDQFSTAQGFYDALIGAYMEMASRDIYGERMTMTNIESLANQWSLSERETSRNEDLHLMQHDYENVAYAQAAVKTIYAKLFNVIAQANMIIKNIEEKGNAIPDPAIRYTLQGEAYAMRAYCQLDLLRLFGEVPGGTIKVELPYSETTGIEEMPAYYNFNAYVEKLKADIAQAEELLRDNDPVMTYSFDDLNGNNDGTVDDNMLYRQSRLNYWAVRALEARMYLYIGDKSKAAEIAREIINAQVNGAPVMTMSGATDFTTGYKLCPSECLFYLSKWDVMDYSRSFLVGGQSSFSNNSSLGITTFKRDAMYTGQNITTHNRYKNCWNDKAIDNYGQSKVVTTKYYWDENALTSTQQMFGCQIIPMLRMSEIYLMAMEGATSLTEANELYYEYRLAHEVPTDPDFSSLQEVADYMIPEYRREFFAEGQLFYTYKRLNATNIMGSVLSASENPVPMTEEDYIVPLPTTEYNPNNPDKTE